MSNADFLDRLKELVEVWCDRRALRPLARVLPAYTAFNGMTEGWGTLLAALKNVLTFCPEDITKTEASKLGDLIRSAKDAVHR